MGRQSGEGEGPVRVSEEGAQGEGGSSGSGRGEGGPARARKSQPRHYVPNFPPPWTGRPSVTPEVSHSWAQKRCVASDQSYSRWSLVAVPTCSHKMADRGRRPEAHMPSKPALPHWLHSAFLTVWRPHTAISLLFLPSSTSPDTRGQNGPHIVDITMTCIPKSTCSLVFHQGFTIYLSHLT